MALNNDRAIPFSLSLPFSQLQRMERVLGIAAQQGMLVSPASRPNKLAAELLMQQVARLENEFRLAGLLPHEAPVAPGAIPASMPMPDSARLATDPDARARARAAQGFDGAPVTHDGQTAPGTLSEPPGVDWEKVP